MPEKRKMREKANKGQDSSHAPSRGISELFIHRPITTTLVMVGILLFGFLSVISPPLIIRPLTSAQVCPARIPTRWLRR
jgi:hypothetical protein